MSDIAPLSPRAKELSDKMTKRFLEQITNNLDNAVSYDQVTGTGIISRVDTDSFVGRTITEVANQTSVTNGDGINGEPTIGISATYPGQTSITTLGTITAGNVSHANVTGYLSGSTSKHLDEKLLEIFSVKDYGAVANGVTDDAPAINAAIAAASAAGVHGFKVYLPEGNYCIGSPINLPTAAGTGIQLCGAGRSKTTLIRKLSYTDGDIIFADAVANAPSSVADIRDLSIINSAGTVAHVTDGFAIHIKNRSNVTIRDVLIYEGYGGIHLETSAATIESVNFESSAVYTATGSSKAGLYMTGTGCAAALLNCNFNGVDSSSANELQAGLWIEGCDGLQATNCSFSGQYGVYFKGVGTNIDNCYFTNCISDNCRLTAVIFEGANNPAVYTNIRFNACHLNARIDSGLATSGIYIAPTCDVDYVSFIGCNINESGGFAANINCTVSYQGTPQKSIQFIGCEISLNNRLNTSTYPGIYAGPGVCGLTIVGNNIQNRYGSPVDFQSYAIALQGSNVDCTIVGNKVSPNISGGIYYGGSGYTNLTVYGNLGANDHMGTIDAGTWHGTPIANAYIANTAVANLSGTNTGDQTTISGNAGTATALQTPRAIYGNNFDGTAALTQVIASTYGGTGNGFAKFTGPTTSEKTFTLPNSSETLLYSGGALGTPSSGTATNLSGTAASLTAGAATVLATARTINGVSFNGSANITVPPYQSTPRFRAKRGTNQSIGSASFTKAQLDSETFDTTNAYDNATNYRFTPLVAGYYQVNCQVVFNFSGGDTNVQYNAAIFKNGSGYVDIPIKNTIASAVSGISLSDIVFLNGSTDYIELFVYQDSGGNRDINNGTFMSAALLP